MAGIETELRGWGWQVDWILDFAEEFSGEVVRGESEGVEKLFLSFPDGEQARFSETLSDALVMVSKIMEERRKATEKLQ